MNLHVNILTLYFGVNNKTGAVAKSVHELHTAMISEFSPLSCVCDTL